MKKNNKQSRNDKQQSRSFNQEKSEQGVFTQQQLEWATTNQSSREESAAEQPEELNQLRQAWDWFDQLAQAENTPAHVDINAITGSVVPKVQKRTGYRIAFFSTVAAACMVLIIGVLQFNTIQTEPEPVKSGTQVAINKSTAVNNSTVSNNPVDESATQVAIDTSLQQQLEWTEDSQYDDQLDSLTAAVLNASQGRDWEQSAMSEYNSVNGYIFDCESSYDTF